MKYIMISKISEKYEAKGRTSAVSLFSLIIFLKRDVVVDSQIILQINFLSFQLL